MIIRINGILLDYNYLANNGDVLQSNDDGLYVDIYDDGLVIELDPPCNCKMTPDQTDKLIETLELAKKHHDAYRLKKIEEQKEIRWKLSVSRKRTLDLIFEDWELT